MVTSAKARKAKESVAPQALGSVPGNNGEFREKYVAIAENYGAQAGNGTMAKLNMCFDLRNGVISKEIPAEKASDVANDMAFAYLRKQAEKSNGRKVPENQNVFVSKLRSFIIPEVLERFTKEHYDAVKVYVAESPAEVLAYTDTFESCVRLNTGISTVLKSKEFKEKKIELPTYSEDWMKTRLAPTPKTPATPAADKAADEKKPAADITPANKAAAARNAMLANARALKDAGATLSDVEMKLIEKIMTLFGE